MDRNTRAYTEGVALRLLRQKLLRPLLRLRCPECTVPTSLRPEDLETEVTCPMCSAIFPLGLAVARSSLKATWTYAAPSDLDEGRFREAIALLAARAALANWGMSGQPMPHIFGVELKAADRSLRGQAGDPSCELDLLAFIDHRGDTQAILGEVKHRSRLEEEDLINMRAVGDRLASVGIDSWPLFATLRPSLEPPELELLRAACETAPRASGNQIVPRFPIVLMEPELSAPWLSDEGLSKWCPARSAADLAIASCKRNRGLEDFHWHGTLPESWSCQWGMM
jgi:hypothetical protein